MIQCACYVARLPAGCRYSYLDPTVNKGWDVAALSDVAGDYQGSCGRCYEIGCAPMHLKVRQQCSG